jgi:hypothetical protein
MPRVRSGSCATIGRAPWRGSAGKRHHARVLAATVQGGRYQQLARRAPAAWTWSRPGRGGMAEVLVLSGANLAALLDLDEPLVALAAKLVTVFPGNRDRALPAHQGLLAPVRRRGRHAACRHGRRLHHCRPHRRGGRGRRQCPRLPRRPRARDPGRRRAGPLAPGGLPRVRTSARSGSLPVGCSRRQWPERTWCAPGSAVRRHTGVVAGTMPQVSGVGMAGSSCAASEV